MLKNDARQTMVMNDVNGVVAIRRAEWKYIENRAERPAEKTRQENYPNRAKPELYNLKTDPAETDNVIHQFPEIAKELQERLDRIRKMTSERLENSQ